MNSVMLGIGAAVPKKCVMNCELPKELQSSDEWIIQRTGIRQRFIAENEESSSTLATEAAQKALKHANISANDIDLIIIGTTTGDYTFPSTAVLVQKNLGITRGAAMDVSAACSGFIYALDIADSYIRLKKATCAIVIGAETFSKILDWSDRSTCVLFGDGAGAMVIKASENIEQSISCNIYSDGRFSEHLITTGGVSTTKNSGVISMNGKEVFIAAVEKFNESLNEVLYKNNLTIDDIDIIVPHQANLRIINKMIESSGISSKKVLISIDKYANTSAASIPLAISDNKESVFSKKNIVLLAMGAGFTWGSALIKL